LVYISTTLHFPFMRSGCALTAGNKILKLLFKLGN